VRRTQYEYMSSALPSNSDIARHSRYFAFGPTGDIRVEEVDVALVETRSCRDFAIGQHSCPLRNPVTTAIEKFELSELAP